MNFNKYFHIFATDNNVNNAEQQLLLLVLLLQPSRGD